MSVDSFDFIVCDGVFPVEKSQPLRMAMSTISAGDSGLRSSLSTRCAANRFRWQMDQGISNKMA
jgi:hypothetical protein